MSDYENIHKVRQRIGSVRQQTYADALKRLHEEMLQMEPPLEHPYSLTDDDYDRLLENNDYKVGGKGRAAEPPKGGFLYRLSGAMQVARSADVWTAVPTTENNNEDIWWLLTNDHYRNQGWIKLSWYAEGSLKGFRGITWWTSLDLLKDKVPLSAYKLGIPNDRIPLYAVILRCPADFLKDNKLARVPTVLDAFDSEIFHPSRDEDKPRCGTTIGLKPSGPLGEGVDEYVVGPIPVDEVEIWPVLIDKNEIRIPNICRGESLCRLLDSYYNAFPEAQNES
ncbi:MAG TPA: hypothetical protein VKA70_12685 [Blastocatellia bacterium]|nr:hypothetical protein [Blastocatellia bacterium]